MFAHWSLFYAILLKTPSARLMNGTKVERAIKLEWAFFSIHKYCQTFFSIVYRTFAAFIDAFDGKISCLFRPLDDLNILPPHQTFGIVFNSPSLRIVEYLRRKNLFDFIYRHGATSLPEVKFGYLLAFQSFEARVLFLELSFSSPLLCDVIQCLFCHRKDFFLSTQSEINYPFG